MEDDFDIVKIKKLFDVTQAVMINRNQLLEDAMNEAEVEAKKSLKRDVNSDLCTGNRTKTEKKQEVDAHEDKQFQPTGLRTTEILAWNLTIGLQQSSR